MNITEKIEKYISERVGHGKNIGRKSYGPGPGTGMKGVGQNKNMGTSRRMYVVVRDEAYMAGDRWETVLMEYWDGHKFVKKVELAKRYTQKEANVLVDKFEDDYYDEPNPPGYGFYSRHIDDVKNDID